MGDSELRVQFDAAVKVIQNLPKDGGFKPSNETMLRFYAFFKQATIGPCNVGKPYAWDMVGRAKWNAWNDLGEMGPEDAMRAYVEELKRILEVMPLNDDVMEIWSILGPFYSMVFRNDPFQSQTNTLETLPEDREESSDDDFCDPIVAKTPPPASPPPSLPPALAETSNGALPESPNGALTATYELVPSDAQQATSSPLQPATADQLRTIQNTLDKMQSDINFIMNRVQNLQHQLTSTSSAPQTGSVRNVGKSSSILPTRTKDRIVLAAIFLWPLALHFFFSWRRRARKIVSSH